MCIRIFLCLLLCIASQEAYKILVYNPNIGHSHTTFLGRVADILVEAGHNVTSLVVEMDSEVKTGTILSNIIRIEAHPNVAASYAKIKNYESYMNYFEQNLMNPLLPILMNYKMSKTFVTNCKHVVSHDNIIQQLTTDKYDIMIAESVDMCGTGLSHVIQPKSFITITSTFLNGWHFDELCIDAALSYSPSSYISHLDVHSFWSRISNLYAESLSRITYSGARTAIERVLRDRYTEDYPSMQEIASRSAFVLANSEPLIDFATPTTSRVIHIPGLGAREPKALEEKWSSLMMMRQKAILLSFGSLSRSVTLSELTKISILKTIANFPDVTFVWKYENTTDDFATSHASKVDNLILSEWMPQVDLLYHSRTVAFITHGGMGSTQETAMSGVPGIFVPIFNDQPRNAGMMEFNGIGKVFSKYDLGNEEKLTAAIRDVLNNEIYRINAKKMAAKLRKKPITSKEQLIRHVEFAAEFGPSSALRPQSCDMNFIQYHNIDLLILLSISFCLISFVILSIPYTIIKYCLKA